MNRIRMNRIGSQRRRGAAMVEFAIIMPVFLTLILGILELGKALQTSNIMTAAVREGGRLSAMDWEGLVPDDSDPNEKVEDDIRNFLAASGIPPEAVDISITSAEGADEGDDFDLNDPDNKLRLFRITVTVPFSAISTFPSHFMAGETVTASLVFRSGRTTLSGQ